MRLIDVLTSPWAIVPDKLVEIQNIYAAHFRGEKIDIKALEAKLGQPLNNKPQGYDVIDGVAVLPIDGVISKRMNMFTQISGGVSTELIGRDFKEALNDPSVNSIILRIDSPGGSVDGTQNLADVISSARGVKPVVAFADGLMASAAYWVGAAADKIYISGETTQVGSIGVVAQHVDISREEEMRGVKTTEIYAGKYKRIASNYKPLSEDGRSTMQDQVDYIYSVFVGSVAKNRGVSEETVLSDMADGRIFIGQQAVKAGLVDGVSTLERLISDLSNRAGAALIQSTKEGHDMEMTLEKLVADHPQIADALRAEGRQQGAEAERARIKDVEAQSMPGHEKLIGELKFDGKTTGPEAAVKVLGAEKSVRETRLANIKADAPAPLPAVVAEETKAQEKSAQEVADLATGYINEQKAKGIVVSPAKAVAHVTKGA